DRIDVLEDIIASKRLGEVLADPVGDVVAVVAAIAEEDLHGGERAGHTDRADESAGASRGRLEATRAPSPRLRVPPYRRPRAGSRAEVLARSPGVGLGVYNRA